MAIAVGSTSSNRVNPGTSNTFALSAAGSDRLAYVSCGNQDGSGSVIPTATYGGVAMTQIDTLRQAVGYNPRVTNFYRLGASISGNVVLSQGTSGLLHGAAAMYTGVNQTGQPDSHNTNSVTSATSLTTSTTVVASNCWLIGSTNYNGGGVVTSAGAGTTKRVEDPDFITGLWDSNGTVSTGSQSLIVNAASSSNIIMLLASFAPVAGGGETFIPKIMMS